MKRIYLFSLLSIFSLNLYCQVHWEKDLDNPLLGPGSNGEWDEGWIWGGSVLHYKDLYHMWYSNGYTEGKTFIGYATSPDGITWTKYENNPMFQTGPSNSWDDNMVMGPIVLVKDSIFHMWYTGHSGGALNENYKIGHATSTDGINWTRDPENPVLDKGSSGSWDGRFVARGTALHDGNEFHLWYAGWDGVPGEDNLLTGHATSPDGTTWKKDTNNPVLRAGTWDRPRCVPGASLYDGTNYHLFYYGGELLKWEIGYAVSADGSAWVKKGLGPVMQKGESGSWDDSFVSPNAVIYDSTESIFKMWYSGGESGHMQIGYAESNPYVHIPDTAFLHALIDEGVDTNGDSLISYTEAEAIISLDVRAKGISDMTGIEAFVNLDTLACWWNPLTSLDVSKNIALVHLDCGFNKLTSLDVSKNIALVHLNCAVNELTSLDVTKNTSLNELFCSGNELTSLELSNNVKLTSLMCGYRPFPASIIPANPLTSLKISNCTALKELHCNGCKLNSLDIRNNDSIEYLDLADMPTLNEVCVWETFNIDSIEIDTSGSPNVNLTTECSSTGIKENKPSELLIYPNPANDLLTIETVKLGQRSIEITSLNGQLLYIDRMEGPTHQIDLSSFEKGLYFITIRSKDFVRTEKVIKL